MKAAEHPGGSEHRLSLEATIELFLKKIAVNTSLSEIRYIMLYIYIIWLVVLNIFFIYFPFNILEIIIPIDEVIFF